MLYAILCFNSEEMIDSWTKEHDDKVMTDLKCVNEKIASKGKLGPVARLGPSKTARTLRKQTEPFLITDGPYAETKEQILGFWIVDCDSEEEAMQYAIDLGKVNPGGGYEVRPLLYFRHGPSVMEGEMAQPNVAP